MSTDSVALSDDVVRAWQSLVDTMAEAFHVPAGLIMRLTGDEIEVFIASDTEGNPYTPGDREVLLDSGLYCERVIRTREPLLVPDALADPVWRDNPDVKFGMISYLGMPILFPDGSPFGTICVLDNKGNAFSDLYIDLLRQFRSLAEHHLSLAILNVELDRKNRELEAAVTEVRTLKEILPVCMRCNKVRDDDGYWSRLEAYLSKHRQIAVSHSLCPECAAQWEEEMTREFREGN